MGSPILGTFDSMPFLNSVKSLLLLVRIGCLRRVYGRTAKMCARERKALGDEGEVIMPSHRSESTGEG